MDQLCTDVLNIIEDFADEITIRLLNKQIYNNLKDIKKYATDCNKCKRQSITEKYRCLYPNCAYCLVKERCYECGKYNYLIKVNACASHSCCHKCICYDNCKFKCELCQKYFDDPNFMKVAKYDKNTFMSEEFMCNTCDTNDKYCRALVWSGISSDEYDRRYG